MTDAPTTFPPDKEIVFVFKGGPRDGERVSISDGNTTGIENEAKNYWAMTDMGTKGKVLMTWLTNVETFDPKTHFSGPPAHYYKVVNKEEPTPNEIVVTCEYVPPGQGSFNS